MRSRIKLALHAVESCYLFAALVALYNIDDELLVSAPSGHLYYYYPLFFSGWGFAVQVTFVFVSLFCDVMMLETSDGYVAKNLIPYAHMLMIMEAKDFVFTALLVPFGMFVNIGFWVVFKTDRDLIMPVEWDEVFTPFINYAMHSSTLLMILIEMIIDNKDKPKSHLVNSAIIWAVGVFYAICFVVNYLITGVWIYILFENFSWYRRFQVMFFCIVSSNVFYFIGYYTNVIIGNICALTKTSKSSLVMNKSTIKID